MSGLVALFAPSGAPVDQELLSAMTATQRFRGADGEATWHGGFVAFGHTQHRATLEADREHQPCSLRNRLFITADARVDGRHDLCARLRDRGHELGSDATDPELLLHAYDAWGEDCLEYLLGDFSFALWDAPRRRLICAVDHLGVKPFYYANRGGLFVGSNSLECVRLHPHVRCELNEIAVGDFLVRGHYEDRDITIYSDIARIPPGHSLVVEANGLRVRRYFSMPQPAEVQLSREEEYLEQLQELLGHAVRDRLRTPRVAVFMSGGIDSPLIAMTAKRQLQRQFANPVLEAFTFAYDTLIPHDERHYASLVGRSLGISVGIQALDDVELFDWIGRLVPPEPVQPSGLDAVERTSKLASGFPVALTGWDGDALFAAATRWHWLERIRERRFRALAREVTWFLRHERALPPVGLRTQVRRWRERGSRPKLPPWLRDDFCARGNLEQHWASVNERREISRSREPSSMSFASPLWALLFNYYDPGYLRFALDVRHPFADLRVIRFALGLAAVPWCVGKHLLRRCLHGLPEAILRRPKSPLRADPVLQRFRGHGLGRAATLWQAPALEGFVDTVAVRDALSQRSMPHEHTSLLLRVVGLGVWLSARDGQLDGDALAPSALIHDTTAST